LGQPVPDSNFVSDADSDEGDRDSGLMVISIPGSK
jgi:hypothetical protein